MVNKKIKLVQELELLRPYLNHTWKGKFAGTDKYDVQKREAILNGTPVQIMHTMNQGEYGGETLFFWDKSLQSLTFFYFTTAGFYTDGTMRIEDDEWINGHEIFYEKDDQATLVFS